MIFTACESDRGGSSEGLLIGIGGADGGAPAAYCVTAAVADQTVVHLCCPGDDAPGTGLSCTGEGVLVEGPPELLEVTVKARGYRFVHQQLRLADLPAEDRLPAVRIDLEPLPEFIDLEDYTTGYREQGLDRFLEMAHTVNTELGPTHLVKFYIDNPDGDPEVYFQNTLAHPIHYDFVHEVLGAPLSLAEFEAITYRGQDRTAMAGTLIWYPAAKTRSAALGGEVEAPMAVSFFPSDDLTPGQAALAHRLLEERMGFAPLTDGPNRVVYLPAGDMQEAQAAGESTLLESRDVPWLTRAELYGNLSLQILNPGLAYGTLRLLSPEELEQAVVSYTDILVLTGLPNGLPVVGGTITEELQTPLAHVNVAARTRGTPNIALPGASEDPRVTGLLGELVRFEVAGGTFSLDAASLDEAQAFWRERVPAPLVPEMDLTRDDLPGFAGLSFDDAVSVGVKAANLAELYKLLGDRAPRGFAIPFHYYDRFMTRTVCSEALCEEARADCVEEGRGAGVCDSARDFCLRGADQSETLWDSASRLVGDASLKIEAARREAVLNSLRYLIRHSEVDAAFGDALDARVAQVFGEARARLRSSTNAEDLPGFSGAGLYDSVPAYASGDKVASAQVRKVFASAWNWRAYEERSFWNIDHLAVRMGVAVSLAFPDEAANGVILTQNVADPAVAGMYVNVQLGEVPVTNPEGGALPEIFSIIPSPRGDVQVVRLRYSSLSPDASILDDGEIAEMFRAADQVQRHFAPLYNQSPFSLCLDLEFKLHGPGRDLFIKQARPYAEWSKQK